MQTRFTTVNLTRSLDEIIDIYRPTIEDSGRSISFEGEPVAVRGDRKLLQRVAANLLDNFILHMPVSTSSKAFSTATSQSASAARSVARACSSLARAGAWLGKTQLMRGEATASKPPASNPSAPPILTRGYPPYVFDIPQDVCRKIATEGYMHHTPEAADKLLTGQRVIEAAAGYDRAVKGVRASFYNETVAAQAAKRVEA